MNILKRALVTEKSMDAAKRNYYSFLVALDASKHQIKEAVEKQFSVSVTGVRTSILPGKSRRVGKTRRQSTGSDFKKAIVRVKEGQSIDTIATMPEEEKKS